MHLIDVLSHFPSQIESFLEFLLLLLIALSRVVPELGKFIEKAVQIGEKS